MRGDDDCHLLGWDAAAVVRRCGILLRFGRARSVLQRADESAVLQAPLPIIRNSSSLGQTAMVAAGANPLLLEPN